MANYITYIGEKQLLLEAPAVGAFTKSDGGVTASPMRAIQNMVATIKDLAEYMGDELTPVLEQTGASFELSFAVRADGNGLVMVSESAEIGQFQCKLTWGGGGGGAARAAKTPRAVGDRPALPGPTER